MVSNVTVTTAEWQLAWEAAKRNPNRNRQTKYESLSPEIRAVADLLCIEIRESAAWRTKRKVLMRDSKEHCGLKGSSFRQMVNQDKYEMVGTLPNKGAAHKCTLEAVNLSQHQRNEDRFVTAVSNLPGSNFYTGSHGRHDEPLIRPAEHVGMGTGVWRMISIVAADDKIGAPGQQVILYAYYSTFTLL